MYPNSGSFLESLEHSHDFFPNLPQEISIRQYYVSSTETTQMHHPIYWIYWIIKCWKYQIKPYRFINGRVNLVLV